MEKKKRLIPFNWTPASWGLAGKSFQRAEAEYYYEGYDLEKRMVEIDYDEKDHPLENLRVDHKYEKITDYDFAHKSAEMTLEGDALALRKLDIEYAAEKITQTEYEKQTATIKKEPFITILNTSYNPQLSVSGLEFEFDWNEFWIKELVDNGYVGYNEDQIIQQWFEDLCRSVVTENMEAQDTPFNSGRVINSRRRGPTADFS